MSDLQALGDWTDKGMGLADILDQNGVEIVRIDGVLYSNDSAKAQRLNASYDALAPYKDAVCAAIEALFGQKIGVVSYGGHPVQADDKSRGTIADAVLLAQVAKIAGGWNANFYWTMADNGQLPMPTPDDMIAFGVAVANVYAAAFFFKDQMKRRIRACVDQPAVDAIDITAGWPV